MITCKPDAFLDGDLSTYQAAHAFAAAEHAIAVYKAPDRYAAACMLAGFDGATIVSRGAAQVGVAWCSDLILLSARGSSQLGDWAGNICSFIRRPWEPYMPPKAKMGVGWRWQLNRSGPAVLEWVQRLKNKHPGAQIVVDGHSLGGAKTSGLVIYLDHHGYDVLYSYAFEPPRPGNRAMASWYDERFTDALTPTYTVIHVVKGEVDLVTRVPLKRRGARHLGRCVMVEHGQPAIHGWEAWQAHRDANPVSGWHAARIATRAHRSVRAHLGGKVLKTLGCMSYIDGVVRWTSDIS